MNSSLWRLVGIAAASAALVLPVTVPAATSAAGPDRSEHEDAVASHTVTLVTGDVVKVTRHGDRTSATVEPSPTSASGVQTLTIGDDLYVIPEEALPYLAAGRLDRELLNVTGLIEQGYDDANADALPLIAQYASNVTTAAGRSAPVGASKKIDLASINGAAITASRRNRDLFWVTVAPQRLPASPLAGRFTNGITKLWLDRKLEVTLGDSVPQVGAPEAWAAGYDGTGATVAVLDTGVDASHPDLAGQIVASESFVPGEDTGDVNGHGTHVASTIAGTGEASGGTYKGVAPGADLVVGKVLDASGYGQASWLIDGMEWAAGRADVVSMSLGDPEYTDGLDPMSQAVNELTADTGVLFVVAAGNSGAEFSVGSPGAAEEALTVAAVDGSDDWAWFSSMGPRSGDHGLKPDISAPGVDVTAARSQQMSWGEGWYQSLDGTSMATPHVSGAAAILAARHPSWSAGRLKDALMSSAKPLPDKTPYEVGTGRLDIPAALGDVHATGSVYFGFFDWPHDGDAVVSRTITYSNSGSAPAVLELTEQVRGPDGASSDLFELSAETVTVPAGGTAQVSVTADPDDAQAVGRYTGFVVATTPDGSAVARSAVGLVKEGERYDLEVSALDRSGAPGTGYVTVYDFVSPWPTFLTLDPQTGKAKTQRLAPGPYNISTWLDVQGVGGPDSSGVALLVEPHFVLDRDREVVLDARKAARVTVSTPRPSEDRYRRMQYFHDAGIENGFPFSNAFFASPVVDDLFATPTGAVPGAGFDFAMRWRRGAQLLDLGARTPAKAPFDPLYQGGSTRLDGKLTLDGVYVGTGTPAEYAGIDAKGKAVFITRSDAIASWEWIAPAQDAGAALLVVVNDRPGKLFEYVAGDVPVVSVTQAQGQPLVAAARAGKLSLVGRATAFSKFMYDLVLANEREIPDDLSFSPRVTDLAQIDNRYLGPKGVVYDGRYDCRTSYGLPPCWGTYEPVPARSVRVDYVSTGAGTRWYQDVFHLSGWEQRHDQATYAAGRRTERTWLAPVTRPRLGPGFWGPERSSDFMAVNVPTSSGGDDKITGSMLDEGSTVVSRLYQGDELLAEQPYQAVFALVPSPDLVEYRFEQDTTRTGLWRTSIRTRSVWTFTSRQPDSFDEIHRLPLLQLDLDVATDLNGTVPVSRTGTIRVGASHEPGVFGGGAVEGVTLELSYDDGASWQRASLAAEGNGWKARVDYPRNAAGGFVSLRATGSDDAGNRVEQEIIRAYELR